MKKTLSLLQYFLTIFLAAFIIAGIVNAAVFPTELHNFVAGGVIKSQEINEIEYAIGETGTTSASTITYKLKRGDFTSATSTSFSATNATTSALEVTASSKFADFRSGAATSSSFYVTRGVRVGSLMIAGATSCSTLETSSSGLVSCGSTSGITNISGLTNAELSIQGTTNEIRVATSSVTNTFTFSLPVNGIVVKNATTTWFRATNATSSALSVTAGANIASLKLDNPLIVGSGGTGASTFTSNGVLYGNGTGAVSVTAQGGSNTVLTANAGAPSFATNFTVNTATTSFLWVSNSATTSALTVTAGTQLTTLNVSGSVLGTFDASVAGALLLPIGTAGTINADGRIGIDTSEGQLVYHSANVRVLTPTTTKSFVIASTTALVQGENDIILFRFEQAVTIRKITCFVDPTETGQDIAITYFESDTSGDYSATVDTITCDNDGTIDTAQTDAAMAAGAWFGVRFGAVTGSPRKVSTTVEYTVNRQ